ncbi:MAG: aminotransferase class I/II-fold pyridoxal phosphate-dependent enzyme [Rhodobacteraceae bacterium]|nr:aminotransferase class I/II-fold pyridoxal phosphate-dependent enzyme [Paracoccaceae bacterium]
MSALVHRPWVPVACETYVQKLAQSASTTNAASLSAHIEQLAARNKTIHEAECFNLNPATNAMNPKAEALLAAGLSSRPSLGYPGDKYEMGLEAMEEIEVITAELCAEIFQAKYAEIRVPSGALANMFAFMALCQPGDAIIVPPASIGGHVTHQTGGCAGLFGLDIHEAPVDADGYTVDTQGLAALAHRVKPKLITIGSSLNLFPHPVSALRDIADSVGAKVLFDAAHQCGIIAGKAWPNPLNEGAHLMTMSTYKSLAGPAGGLIVTNDAVIAERLDQIAYPGMTANFDAGKSAALAITMLDWREKGQDYATAMLDVAKAFATALDDLDLPVFAKAQGFTQSHQFAIKAADFGGGQNASKALRQAGFLACGIGLPMASVEGDLNGLRIGTPELVRWGITKADVPQIADLIAQALRSDSPQNLATEVAALRAKFNKIHFVCE